MFTTRKPKDSHQHAWSFEGQSVVADDPNDLTIERNRSGNGVYRYAGIGTELPELGITTKPMAFLYRVCTDESCKHREVMDYGERQAMRVKYKKLMEARYE